MISDEPPLPDGWIKAYDNNYNRHFYVDSKANPPRSIWAHPYEDELYLNEHSDAREKVGIGKLKKSSEDRSSTHKRGRASYHACEASSTTNQNTKNQTATASTSNVQKRGFFGKLKDKAIGSKEERALKAVQLQELEEQRRAQRPSMTAQHSTQYRTHPQQYSQHTNYYQGGYPGQGFGPPANAAVSQGRGGGGFGGIGLPILGGLAGGLLLGEALDGFGDGGDSGGGGFGGGDFGGGDFGGDF